MSSFTSDKPTRKPADGNRLAKIDAAIDARDLPDEGQGPRLKCLEDHLGDPARGGALRGRYLPGHLDLPPCLAPVGCLHRLVILVSRPRDVPRLIQISPSCFPTGNAMGKSRSSIPPGGGLAVKL